MIKTFRLYVPVRLDLSPIAGLDDLESNIGKPCSLAQALARIAAQVYVETAEVHEAIETWLVNLDPRSTFPSHSPAGVFRRHSYRIDHVDIK